MPSDATYSWTFSLRGLICVSPVHLFLILLRRSASLGWSISPIRSRLLWHKLLLWILSAGLAHSTSFSIFLFNEVNIFTTLRIALFERAPWQLSFELATTIRIIFEACQQRFCILIKTNIRILSRPTARRIIRSRRMILKSLHIIVINADAFALEVDEVLILLVVHVLDIYKEW